MNLKNILENKFLYEIYVYLILPCKNKYVNVYGPHWVNSPQWEEPAVLEEN